MKLRQFEVDVKSAKILIPEFKYILQWSYQNEATLMNMDKYFMLIHYEQLHNHNKAKHNKTVCIFLGYLYI